MEKLFGQTILIGKEPGQGRLMVAVSGSGKSATIGTPGCVPASVSRCKPADNVAHAKITVDGEGRMTLTNMKPQNVTYVNGAEIASKRINDSATVELGKDRFAVNLPLLLSTARKLVTPDVIVDKIPEGGGVIKKPEEKKVYNISHLNIVWNNLLSTRKEIQAKQKKINLVRSGCGVFTMCAMPCIFLFGPVGYVLTGIGIVGNIYSFVGLKNDDTSEVTERLNEEFQDKYVCPNPECNKFLGNISYKLLKKQYSMHCPYCKCEYTES